MKATPFNAWIGCTFLAIAAACGQTARRPTVADLRSLAEVPTIKRQAEAGDRQAQLELANIALQARPPRSADALLWYRRAAAQGSLEAACAAGKLLLHGNSAGETSQRVQPQIEAGLTLTYNAATNRYVPAYRIMSEICQSGLAGQTNLVEAYAWLHLYAEADPSKRKTELDSLALQLTSAELDQARQLVLNCKERRWPSLFIPHDSAPDTRFKLAGITVGGRYPLAIINRKTIAEGETASIPIEGGTIVVKCLKVNEDSVLIEVQGESGRKELTL